MCSGGRGGLRRGANRERTWIVSLKIIVEKKIQRLSACGLLAIALSLCCALSFSCAFEGRNYKNLKMRVSYQVTTNY